MTQFTYDGANNLLSETRTGTKPYSGAYTYDRSNRRKTARVITNGITTHNGAYSYDGAGRLSQVVDSATGLTEVYTWNPDGTMASSPGPAGSGYSLLFGYDEEQHLTSLQHNTGGTITTAYQYGYAADGGRRWSKDLANNRWTWYPCGVACNAGELVEQTSDLIGSVWTTSALYLKGGSSCGSRIIRRNSEYHHIDIWGNYAYITGNTANVIAIAFNDKFRVQRYISGTAQTPWRNTKSKVNASWLESTIGQEFSYLPERAIASTSKRDVGQPGNPSIPRPRPRPTPPDPNFTITDCSRMRDVTDSAAYCDCLCTNTWVEDNSMRFGQLVYCLNVTPQADQQQDCFQPFLQGQIKADKWKQNCIKNCTDLNISPVV